jgi:hypothetical protein
VPDDSTVVLHHCHLHDRLRCVMTNHAPYGPATKSIRQFLVRLAALDAASRARVVAAFEAVEGAPSFAAADAMLAETIERSGRNAERDALAGPLLQIARRNDGMLPADGTAQPDDLDPIAEPALAALLALLVADLLPARHFQSLYSPFDVEIPHTLLRE